MPEELHVLTLTTDQMIALNNMVGLADAWMRRESSVVMLVRHSILTICQSDEGAQAFRDTINIINKASQAITKDGVTLLRDFNF